LKVAIMQPTYLPWVGYFDLIDQSDVFVLYDTVQFEKQSWQQRNRLKTAQGVQWLTVPVHQSLGQRIDEVRTSEATAWRHKHWMALVTNYAKAPFWPQHSPLFEAAYQSPWEHLADLNIHLLTEMTRAFGLRSNFVRASSLPSFAGRKEEPLLALCEHFGADTYLSPAGARTYLIDDVPFRARGLSLRFQAYEHPIWPQQFGEFAPHVSAVDLLFHCGSAGGEIVRSGRRPSTSVDRTGVIALTPPGV
jgi:hypothetical protein